MFSYQHGGRSARWIQQARGLASAGLVAGVLCGPANGQAAAELEAGAAIEVREGDVWSAAELVKREGRRFQIRYSDGTEEWVTQDRLRATSSAPNQPGGADGVLKPGKAATDDGAAGVLKPGRADTDDAGDAAEAGDQRRFRTRQKIEYKQHRFWKPGEIKQTAGELYLVGDANSTSNFMSRWMVADTIREPGDEFEGPDTFDQFSHLVGNDDLRESLVEAKKELEEFKLKQSQKARDGSTSRPDPSAMLPFDHPVTKADRSKVHEVVSRAASGQAVTLDPSESPISRPIAVAVKAGTGGPFEKVTNLAISGQYALIPLSDNRPGDPIQTAAERLDLATGRSTGSVAFDAASAPHDISFDGQRVAAIATAGAFFNTTRVDVWDWSGKEPAHLVSFKPSPPATGPGSSDYVTAVRFLADGGLAVVESDGAVSAWRFTPAGEAGGEASVTGVWSIQLQRGATITSSPGGHQLAASSGDEVLLLDAGTGEPLAVQAGLGFAPSQVAFSPSGRYLALASTHQFALWDLAESTLGPRIALPPGRGSVVATDQGRVIMRGNLIDGVTGATVWAYTPPAGSTDFYEAPGTLVGLTRPSGGSRTFATWPLPHPQAAAATAPPARNLFADGSSVALDLAALEGDAAELQQIETNLTEQLKAMGVAVDPTSPVKIVGKTSTESEQQQFREFGSSPFGPTQSATVTTKTTTLSIVADDQTRWQITSRSGGSSGNIRLEEGESLQQNLDRQAAVNLGPFGNVALPQIVPAPAEPQGTTTLRPGGFGN